ncbi:MAG: hypothetical protein V1678_02990 [Candidatus Aenigmatarchaeota archaeon]
MADKAGFNISYKRNKRFARLVRYFVFIALPIIISLILFPFWESELDRFNSSFVVSKNRMLPPSIVNSINSVFKIPFDIQKYYVCFKDLGSYILYSDNSKDYSGVSWVVNFNNTTNQVVNSNSIGCYLTNANEKFTYSLTGNFIINIEMGVLANGTLVKESKSPLTVMPNVSLYSFPETYGLLTVYLLFFISWNTVVYLFTRIARIVKKGFLE